MSSLKEMRWVPPASPSQRWARQLAVSQLERASALLSRLASSLATAQAEERIDARVEFHAEAGAPEGALYVDGRFVGWLAGVRRL